MDEKKELTRREFLGLAAAAAAMALLPGCGEYLAEVAPGTAHRPSAGRGYAYAPVSAGETVIYNPNQAYSYTTAAAPAGQVAPVQYQYTVAQPAPVVQPVQYQYVQQQQPVYRQPAPARRQAPSPAGDRLRAVSRQSWAVVAPNPGKMKPMNGVNRITIHHEGSKPNNDTASPQVAATLRLIQSQHGKRMGAGDIGYHFIIDRTGTIWQGRDWRYQGAHTSGANAHNLGVMLLGNFESQQPTERQLVSMRSLVLSLARMYNLNLRTDIYAHNDFGNTQCPGKNLKQHVRAFKAL